MPELLVTAHPSAPAAHLATEREMEALVYLAASPLPVPVGQVGRDLAIESDGRSRGADRKRGHAICRRIGFAGLVEGGSRYELTEKGRIAAAIVMVMRPGLRAAYFKEPR